MTFTSSLQTAMTRIKAMELLAVTDSKAAENYHTFRYETAPYWVNSLTSVVPTVINPARQAYAVTIAMALHSQPLQAGILGEYETTLMYTTIPAVLAYFMLYPTLDYTSGLDDIGGLQGDLTRITAGSIIVSTDEKATMIAPFTLTLSFLTTASQVFKQP